MTSLCTHHFLHSSRMSGEILTEIFNTLDDLHLFDNDREKGMTPFMLLDGHQSCFDLAFLQYINTDPQKWAIGVPYGTASWQVGDSSEQKRRFNLNLKEVKSSLLQT